MDDSFWLFYGLYIKLKGVFVFEITKTKTAKFTVKFDLNLEGKKRKEDNLTD